jgi:Domain of unknown function (DUF1842)
VTTLATAQNASASRETGLFIASYDLGTGLPGAQRFKLSIVVNTVDEVIGGRGRITQASNAPLNEPTHLNGAYIYLTVIPNQSHILVLAMGYPELEWPSSGGIGPVLQPNVHLRMLLTSDWSGGVASYKYQDARGVWHEVNDVPVKLC